MRRREKFCVGAAMSAVSVVVAVVVLAAPTAFAASADSLYTYMFAGSTGSIDNSATANTSVGLQLQGTWVPTATGVVFTGNTTDSQSVGYAKPVSGHTIDVPGTRAVGSAVKLTFAAPPGSACFQDSPNVTQVGSFANQTTQLKLQLTNCAKNKSGVSPQCRVAGKSTSSAVLPVTSTRTLTDGQTYVVRCIKGPDTATGRTKIELSVTLVDPVNGDSTTTDVFTVANTGLLRSSSYLSVANKYPLPSQDRNTDQFVGEVSVVTYCTGAHMTAARDCLNAELGSGPPAG